MARQLLDDFLFVSPAAHLTVDCSLSFITSEAEPEEEEDAIKGSVTQKSQCHFLIKIQPEQELRLIQWAAQERPTSSV